jgi:hypothetical protein
MNRGNLKANTMTISEFEVELKKLHPDFQVVKLKPEHLTAQVLFRGVRMYSIGAEGLWDDPNIDYGIVHPSGRVLRHPTISEATAKANKVIQDMKEGGENYRATMGIGEFSDAVLLKND